MVGCAIKHGTRCALAHNHTSRLPLSKLPTTLPLAFPRCPSLAPPHPTPPHPTPLTAQRHNQQQQRRSQLAALHGSSPLLLPILPPTHIFIAAWSALMLLLDLTYTAILLPLAFAFDLYDYPPYLAASVTIGFLFTIDMGVMLHRCACARELVSA